MNSANSIFVGCLDDAVWIRVEGKGSYENSPPFREFASKMIDEGHRHFVVDLENCPVMDSTFMGTLTGVALRLTAETDDGDGGTNSPGLEVINANTRCRQLMEGLGLDHIFALDSASRSHCEQSAVVSRLMAERKTEMVDQHEADKIETAEVMLEAHEALAAASESNVPRFRDVIEFLKKDLGRPIEGTA